MKVVIAGSRDFDNYPLLCREVDNILKDVKDIEIVSGTARGADYYGECYAQERGYPLVKFPAMWTLYGRSAGYRRNEQMALYADCVIVFWDGKSKGAEHMIKTAKAKGRAVHIIPF